MVNGCTMPISLGLVLQQNQDLLQDLCSLVDFSSSLQVSL